MNYPVTIDDYEPKPLHPYGPMIPPCDDFECGYCQQLREDLLPGARLSIHSALERIENYRKAGFLPEYGDFLQDAIDHLRRALVSI